MLCEGAKAGRRSCEGALLQPVTGWHVWPIFFLEAEASILSKTSWPAIRRGSAFFHGMLDEGIYLALLRSSRFVSAAHSAEDIQATIQAASRVFAQLTPTDPPKTGHLPVA